MFGGQLGRNDLGHFELGRIPEEGEEVGEVSLAVTAGIAVAGRARHFDAATVTGVGLATGLEFQTFPNKLIMIGTDLVMVGSDLVMVPAE